MIVQANSSTLDLILCDCIYVPDICINLKDYNGSTYNVFVTWETGESTYEPLDLIASEPGWKCVRDYTRNKNKLGCIVNQNKASSYCREPFWKIGVLVLLTHKQEMELEIQHIFKKWQDADETKKHQFLEYHCKGVVIDLPACEQGYSLCRGESAFDYTHEAEISFAFDYIPEAEIRFEKSSFHLLNGDPNVEQHIVTHNLIAWNARTMKEDLVNFETRFKHYLFLEDDDPVFEDWKRSKIKELVTAEYWEQMAGYKQHQGFADMLRAMGFIPSRAEDDIWIRENNSVYEYIAVYVDDLMIAARNPKEIVQILEEQHKFKLKGVGPMTYHLGCDYFRDHDGTLCFCPRKYITKMMNQFTDMYGYKQKEYTSPLEKGEYPEIDTLEELDEQGIKKYQTMVDCYRKRWVTVETANFGSSFTAARIAVDQIIDLRATLRYLGAPVSETSYMFGDNQAVVSHSTIPHSSLNKRHNALAYHRVREMISAKILGYYGIDGKRNPSDIVSKHWSYHQVWHLLKTTSFLFCDTFDLLEEENIIMKNHILTLSQEYTNACYAERATILIINLSSCVYGTFWYFATKYNHQDKSRK
jgi:Reverse transcriptase (RNA-dependent DNA polymerase)